MRIDTFIAFRVEENVSIEGRKAASGHGNSSDRINTHYGNATSAPGWPEARRESMLFLAASHTATSAYNLPQARGLRKCESCRHLTRVPSNELSRSQLAYLSLRDDIFAFRLLPGDRFTESDVAERLGISRTPVREALLRLQTEGLVRGYYRNGWEVVPIDLARFEALYELRTLLETHAAALLCQQPTSPRVDRSCLAALDTSWQVPPAQRLSDGNHVADLDEAFHLAIVCAAGNPEAAAVHRQVTDRIRIIRRLDFAYSDRIDLTYEEHVRILAALTAFDGVRAIELLTAHIEEGRVEVSRLSSERLEQARTNLERPSLTKAPARRRRFG